MKKKGLCFKRAAALSLAAVMIVTAAPQTGLTALAAEQGVTVDTPDVSKDPETLTTEYDASMETGEPVPTKPEEAGAQDGAGADGGTGDQEADAPSDGGTGDQEADTPSDGGTGDQEADVPSDGGTGGQEADAPSDGGIGDQETPENDPKNGEPENDPDEGPAYKGVTSKEEDEEGPFTRLCIDEDEAAKQNTGDGNEDGIAAILEYYAGKNQKFNCVEFNKNVDGEASNLILKKDHINGAVSLLGDENRRWITYDFRQEQGEDIVFTTYCLDCPEECSEDINVKPADNKPHQGVLIHTASNEFPSENISLDYRMEMGAESSLPDCFGGTEEIGVLTWDNGVPTGRMEPDHIWFDQKQVENEDSKPINVCCFEMSIKEMQAGQDYMVTPLYRETVPVNGKCLWHYGGCGQYCASR